MRILQATTGVKVPQALILAQFSKKDVANYFMSWGVRWQQQQQIDNEDNNKYGENDADDDDNDYIEERGDNASFKRRGNVILWNNIWICALGSQATLMTTIW